MPIENKEDIRFTMKLPQETSVITETAIVETAGEAEPTSTQSVEPAAPATPQEKVQVNKSEPVKPAPPKEYTVSEGDTLAEIAKKFYGPEEGNKRAGVMRIFEANRQLLKSPDQIPVGQKLTIPSPGASPPDASKNESVFSGSIFEKAISIGRKHLSPDSGSALRKESPGLISPPKGSKGKPAAEYLVQEGDSLSRIAAQQLGDANRYPEIAKLNADTLTDEDSLTVGMRLKMPAR
jgi:nucleoid-associated protein YgaU